VVHIEKASPGCGAIVTDIDIRSISDSEFQLIYEAWLEAGVICIRGQELTIEDFLSYGRRFGKIFPHLVKKSRHPNHPELTVMGTNARNADGTVNRPVYARGHGWHTDGPWDPKGCKATQLFGLEIPSRGGDTLFANMAMAYNTLPNTLKTRIQNLKADYVYGGVSRKSSELLEPEDRNLPPVRHPLTRTHSETGRKTLYFNPTHLLRIVGLSDQEAKDLFQELEQYQIAPGAEYRHKWEVGDLVTWDNRCTLHSATADYPIEERRVHWRCTIASDDAKGVLIA
jgi:taurine dioxygenase